ncbi:MAG: (2Fe-2S)-binding protein [Deltaproteobacteria bacterium]|nr:(2Fe-2S)-binding protein [Deltaproteobacteria bacterium]
MSERSPVVRFEPWGRVFVVKRGGSLLRAARRARLPISSSCRGEGICLACRVRVLQGAENLSPPAARETAAGMGGDERLACMACVFGPVTITTSYW